MAAQGTGRRHVQILNISDNVAFGPNQWNAGGGAFNYQSFYGHSWYVDVANYANEIYTAAAIVCPSFLHAYRGFLLY